MSGGSALVVGVDAAARGRATGAVVARLAERGYQVCVLTGADATKDGKRGGTIEAFDGPPPPEDVLRRLERPEVSVQVSLAALTPAERRRYAAALLARSATLHERVGRPHWLALDAADELLDETAGAKARFRGSMLLATASPERLARETLENVALVVAVGAAPREALRAAARTLQTDLPPAPAQAGGEALIWEPWSGNDAVWARLDATGEAAETSSAARVLR